MAPACPGPAPGQKPSTAAIPIRSAKAAPSTTRTRRRIDSGSGTARGSRRGQSDRTRASLVGTSDQTGVRHERLAVTVTKVPGRLDVGSTDCARSGIYRLCHGPESESATPPPSPTTHPGRRRPCGGQLARHRAVRVARAGRGAKLWPDTIEAGTVTPATGTTATIFQFSVTVSDRAGATPTWVRLGFNGTWSDMTPSGTTFRAGVVYHLNRTLPVGSWTYVFQARTGGTVCEDTQVGPSPVVVTVPPTPSPTPKATPKPPKATPKPTRATPGPGPKSTPKPGKATRPTQCQTHGEPGTERDGDVRMPPGSATASLVPSPDSTPAPPPRRRPRVSSPVRWMAAPPVVRLPGSMPEGSWPARRTR